MTAQRVSFRSRLARTLLIALILASAALPGASGAAPSPTSPVVVAAPPTPPAAGAFAPGRVLVGWHDDLTKEKALALLKDRGHKVLAALDPLPAAVLAVPAGQELAAVAALQADRAIAYAEPDYLAYALGSRAVAPDQIATPGVYPSDPLWPQQWGMRRAQAPLAWPVTTGRVTVLVAMIDSGIDLGHPEFAGRIVTGYDYINQDLVPQDDYGHGTHIAGIVAAAGDNAAGVAGMAWGVRLLVYKALDNTGVGPASFVAQAVLDAVARGARIINLSLALTAPSETLRSALQHAFANNTVIVGATGNNSGPVAYPAAYPEVIAVAATTHWDDWTGYSNYGPLVDLAAPGGSASDPILSTWLNGSYAWQYGTSVAAPAVAGVAALMRSLNPRLSNLAIGAILRSTADKVGAFTYVNGRNDYLGYGRLNAALAVRQALPPTLAVEPEGMVLLAAANDQHAAHADVTLSNPSSQPLTWQVVEISADWLDLDPPWSGTLSYPATATLRGRVIAPRPVGDHTASVRLRLTGPEGPLGERVVPVRLRVTPTLRSVYLPLMEHRNLTTAWYDLSVGSTGLSLSDDAAQVVGLPFSFPFYGERYTQAWVHANGFLSFGRGYPGSQHAFNGCIPSLQPPDGAIYALWTDLDPSRGGQVRYATVDDLFVVEWRDVPRRGSSAPNTFQVVLWPDGRVLVQYEAVAPGNATAGLENWDNTMGWQVACNGVGARLGPGSAWLLRAAPP